MPLECRVAERRAQIGKLVVSTKFEASSLGKFFRMGSIKAVADRDVEIWIQS